ncbi:MAG TPA: isoprenylcysteine carboxylmethyltransferase family protein [Chitinophagaceae bacterium]|nr:isoprenylcysteine carboxylmethyltransferase family protein [Chitinophagaceae bacterium]
MVNGHLVLAFLWLLFGVLHSVFAALRLKQRFANAFPKKAKHYRLLYTLFAFLNFGIVIWYQVQLPSPLLYTPKIFITALGLLLAITGFVIMMICIKKYFLSLSGLKSLFQERPSHQLMISGIHRFVRHPLYLGTFAAIWGAFLVFPILSLLISNFLITAYTLFGIKLEEKKLVAEFGAAYTTYKQTVPKLLPLLRRKPVL